MSLCACGCGRPLSGRARRDLLDTCYTRWIQQGKPASGPRPPMSHAERTAIARAARAAAARLRAAEVAEYEPDEYDLAWAAGARARRAAEARGRAVRASRLAADLIRCRAAGDRKGERELRQRVTDWEAVALVLADRAVAGATLAAAGSGRHSAGKGTLGRSASLSEPSEGQAA